MAFLNETGLEQVWGKIKTKVSSIENTISDINKAKVDKISGKDLSTNDFTTDEKNKLAGIATGATKVIVDSALSSTSTNAIQNKAVMNMKINIDDELSNKPSKTGDGASGTWGINISGNAATATKATQDGSGNVITSKYTTLDTSQTITGAKTFSSEVKMTKGHYVHSFSGTMGSIGYIKIATLTIKGAYQNAPISFKIIQRGIPIPYIISITFQNSDGYDPALISFKGYGLDIERAYLHKSNTSTWDLYIQKTEEYDKISIIDFNISYNTDISISWVSNTQVSTLPTGGTTCSYGGTIGAATKLATARTLTIGNTGKSFNGSGNVSWSLSEIGAAAASHGTHVTSATVKSALGTGTGTSKYLREDGTWVTPPNTNTHYTTRLYAGASGTVANAAATNPYLKVTDDNTYRNQIQFKGGGATTVSSDANGVITISSTDTNTHAVTSVFGRTGAVTLTKSDVTTALGYTPPTTDTNTTYSAGTGLSLSGTKFSVSTVPVGNGGTGSTSKSGARTNLGIISGTSLPSASGYASGDIFILY